MLIICEIFVHLFPLSQSPEHERYRGHGDKDAARIQGPLSRSTPHQGGAGLFPLPLQHLEGGEMLGQAAGLWVRLLIADNANY